MKGEKVMMNVGKGDLVDAKKDAFRDELPVLPEVTAQKVQTQYMTAVTVQRPRKLEKIVNAVLREAEYAGESFFYAWGMGKNHIEGPSVGLALCVAREWSNCAVETSVDDIGDAYIFTSHFIDLERGFTISRSFRQSKRWTVYGKMDEFRKDDTRFQMGQSKSIRNVVRAAVPSWLIEQAIEKAKDAVRAGITKEGIATAIEKAIKLLGQHGITEDRVLAKIDRKNKHEITKEDIIDLRTAYSAISKGESFADDIFPPSQAGHAAGADPEPPEIPLGVENEKAPNPAEPPEGLIKGGPDDNQSAKKGTGKKSPAPHPVKKKVIKKATSKKTPIKKPTSPAPPANPPTEGVTTPSIMDKLLIESVSILGREKYGVILERLFPGTKSAMGLSEPDKKTLMKGIEVEVSKTY